MRPYILAFTLSLAVPLLFACGSSGTTGDGGADAAIGDGSASSDPVLGGRWEAVFFGKDFDVPNGSPSLDVRAGKAHFQYNAKTGASQYIVFDKSGGQQEIAFPQGTKDPGRVTTLPDGASVVVLLTLFNGSLTAFRQQGGAATAIPAPAGPSVSTHRPELVTLGDTAVVATIAGAATPTMVVQRMGTSGWEMLGQFSAATTIARIRLASDGKRMALASVDGTNRVVRSWENGTWTELSGLPMAENGGGLPAVVVDGARVFFLEWQEGPQQSVVWLHEGGAWSEWARSQKSEAFHGLVLHGGALYTLHGVSPNFGGQHTTYGMARVDRGSVTRGRPAEPDGARFDVMEYEESYLVSRDGDLFIAYQEMGAAPAVRLLRLVPR